MKLKRRYDKVTKKHSAESQLTTISPALPNLIPQQGDLLSFPDFWIKHLHHVWEHNYGSCMVHWRDGSGDFESADIRGP